MSRQRETPLNGAEQDNTKGQMHNASRGTERDSDGDVIGMTAEEREAAALLRIVGWRVEDTGEVAEDEADLIVRAAASETVNADELARVREGVLRRRLVPPLSLTQRHP